jgi:hypothetical protein
VKCSRPTSLGRRVKKKLHVPDKRLDLSTAHFCQQANKESFIVVNQGYQTSTKKLEDKTELSEGGERYDPDVGYFASRFEIRPYSQRHFAYPIGLIKWLCMQNGFLGDGANSVELVIMRWAKSC